MAVPVQIVIPGVVQIVGRKGSAVFLQLPQTGLLRWTIQFQAGSLDGFVGFLAITATTGRHDVIPASAAAFGAGNNVVKGEVFGGKVGLAVLAGKFIPKKRLNRVKAGLEVLTT